MSNKITFIGDIHGKLPQLKEKLGDKDWGTTIAVGDVGMGFHWQQRIKSTAAGNPSGEERRSGPIDRHTNLKSYGIDGFIRGNHDSPEESRASPYYMGDYGYDPFTKIFWLGGAWSIDIPWRTEGLDWWPDEQLSYRELDAAWALYDEVKPKIVVTHDCPLTVTDRMDFQLMGNGEIYTTSTGLALAQMLQVHQPELWVFGHYHQRRERQIEKTKFVCVEELGTYTIEV